MTRLNAVSLENPTARREIETESGVHPSACIVPTALDLPQSHIHTNFLQGLRTPNLPLADLDRLQGRVY